MEQDIEQEPEEIILDKHHFFFEAPLYQAVAIPDADDVYDLSQIFDGDVDAYSAKNGIDTTYHISHYDMDGSSNRGFGEFSKIKLKCARKPDDVLYYFVLIEDGFATKVGQYPSLADLQFAEIGKKYDKLLAREDIQEFKKAIGLAAHGVGAGSFVYLRRIFEKLINQTRLDNAAALEIDEEAYFKLRMFEKVDALKEFLPSQLLEMKQVYSILSVGVHELSEQECLAYFPALKLSIELILDQRIENELKSDKDKKAREQIAAIDKVLKQNKQQ
jgi:hypothetical protein